jgi:hypothetical protein
MDEGRYVYADEPHAVAEARAQGRTEEATHANARLIAAAPDLLAACKAVRMTATPGAPDGYVLIPVSAHADVLAAIAKAEGGAA